MAGGPQVSQVVECSQPQVGKIIGTGGATIKELQSKSGARIQIDQNYPPDQVGVICQYVIVIELDKRRLFIYIPIWMDQIWSFYLEHTYGIWHTLTGLFATFLYFMVYLIL
jgi:hypothetical protein